MDKKNHVFALRQRQIQLNIRLYKRILHAIRTKKKEKRLEALSAHPSEPLIFNTYGLDQGLN